MPADEGNDSAESGPARVADRIYTALYDTRRQTQAKHDLLRAYLEPFAFKVLQRYGSLDFVDGFAGPWESRDVDGFSDTSFGIAVEVLNGVAARLADMGRTVRVRCVFNERDRTAFAQLEGYVAAARVRYPRIELHATQGAFAANAATMDGLCRHRFRLVYVDPTGWTGYPRDALCRIVPRGRPAEIIINFMASFARRFLVSPADRRERWLDEMLGPERAERLRGRHADESDIRRAIGRVLREELDLDYVCETPIAFSEMDAVHFWMLYGTRSSAGVELLRNAEVKAIGAHEASRDTRRMGNQGSLFEMPIVAPYSTMRDEHLESLDQDVTRMLAQIDRPIRFGQLAAWVMTRRYVRKTEVKDAIVQLAKAGHVVPSWKERNERSRTPDDDDLIAVKR